MSNNKDFFTASKFFPITYKLQKGLRPNKLTYAQATNIGIANQNSFPSLHHHQNDPSPIFFSRTGGNNKFIQPVTTTNKFSILQDLDDDQESNQPFQHCITSRTIFNPNKNKNPQFRSYNQTRSNQFQRSSPIANPSFNNKTNPYLTDQYPPEIPKDNSLLKQQLQ